MSRLVLVRHGQARSFEDRSDRLTELGKAQSESLRDWFRTRSYTFEEVQCGTLERQRHTADLLGSHGHRIADARWNEYDATRLVEEGAPQLAAADAAFAELVARAKRFRNTPDANRHFQPMFERLMRAWIGGQLPPSTIEPWPEFLARVRAVFTAVLEGGRRDVLVITSGGVIGAAVQQVLRAPDEMAIELNWRMRNTSVTEFLFTTGRVSLDQFNAVPHLVPALITYR